MTYLEEKKIRDADKAKRARKYRFEPVLFDRLNPPANRPDLRPGTLVVIIKPAGCPINGTMGMCYIGDSKTGEFIGLVMVNSLVAVKR